MSTLVIAEHDGHALNRGTYQAVTAAQTWNQPVHLLLLGDELSTLAEQAASIQGVAQVIKVEAQQFAHPIAEDVSQQIVDLAADYPVILAAHSSFSRNALPRAAALLDVAMISDVLTIKPDNTYVRSIYAGDIHTTVQSQDRIQVLTIRGSFFEAASVGNQAEIISVNASAAFANSQWIKETKIETDLPELGTANIVVSGGRSLGSAEQFEQVLSPLAHKLGAALGATRAAVDAGYAANEIQVGQTGVTVAPDLYLAIGISGAVQHTAGMKDSRVVVAINADPDAPIFQVADYGLVADLFDVVPALTQAVQQRG